VGQAGHAHLSQRTQIFDFFGSSAGSPRPSDVFLGKRFAIFVLRKLRLFSSYLGLMNREHALGVWPGCPVSRESVQAAHLEKTDRF
jgi:hypothetical protein